MTINSDACPFNAGFGNDPPYLAGRQDQILFIKSALDNIKVRKGKMDKSPKSMAAIVGPRGEGNTVLLQRAEEMAQEHGIHVASINNSMLSSDEYSLVNEVHPTNWLINYLRSIRSLKLFEVGLGLSGTESRFRSALMKSLSRKPLLIFLDEAHAWKPEALKLLYDNALECIRTKLPIAVIVAGTPGLEPLSQRC